MIFEKEADMSIPFWFYIAKDNEELVSLFKIIVKYLYVAT